MTNDFPIDPILPEGFDSTPNTMRSKEHLDTWWDRPYAISNGDGSYSVRCLHGGSWDRSTWMGKAGTIEEAREIGILELKKWKEIRAKLWLKDDDGKFEVVRMPQRPDMEEQILGVFDTQELASAFMKS